MSARTFILDTPERLPNFTGWLGKQELPLDVTVRPYEPKRSNAANKRLWALHTLAAEITGYSPEEMHELSLIRHFGFAEKSIGNSMIRVPLKRSSQRNKKEFTEFMESTEAFYATEFSVWLGKDETL